MAIFVAIDRVEDVTLLLGDRDGDVAERVIIDLEAQF